MQLKLNKRGDKSLFSYSAFEAISGQMKEEGFRPADIIFIGSGDGKESCTWKEFKKMALETEWDENIREDLTIIFKGGVQYALYKVMEYEGTRIIVVEPYNHPMYRRKKKRKKLVSLCE